MPFCAAKCHYCDFFSVAGAGQDVDGLLATLLEEVRALAPQAPRTVFLGGGTPSYLTVAQLRRFLDGLDRATGFRASATEVTAECNPESLDVEKARALRELGVRRLSIGFQALSEEALARFGRVHSVADSFRAYAAARDAGFEDVNVDLIYAWPDQTLEEWDATLERVLALGPDHLSAYNLTFEEATPFQRALERGELAQASEELELAMFDLARSRTRAAGLEAYEISNYARPGRRCEHNVNYWRNGPYLGVGPSAASRVGATRRGNAKSLAGYARQIAEQGHAAQWDERLEPRARLAETWWLGLRLAEGVDPREARAAAGLEAEHDDFAIRLARELAGQGLLEERAGRMALSARGVPLADHVGREFLGAAR